MYKLFVALRYLRANKIIYFSIAGVAVGIMVMIIVTSVMGGFSRDIQSRIRGLQSHLVVKPLYADRLIGDYEEIVRKIREIPHVTGASPRIEYAAWMTYRGSPRNVVVFGVDPRREADTSELRRFFTRGDKEQWNFLFDDGEAPDPPEPLREAAPPGIEWGVVAGSEIYAHEGLRIYLQTVRQGNGPMYLRGDFSIVGKFKSGMAEYDSEYLFMDLLAMQQYMKLAPPHQGVAVVNTIAIAVDDYDRNVQSVRMKVAEALHGRSGRCSGEEHASGYCGSFRIATWEEARSILLQAVAIERGIQVIILFCIVIVAGFNIIAIYTMMVRAKTRDVGILRSLGATRGGVTSIFLVSGGLCGLFGSLFGIILGALIATNLNEIVGFVRVTSRELNRAAWPAGAEAASRGTTWLAMALFGLALGALVYSWLRLYRPFAPNAWVRATPAAGLAAAGAVVFFGWVARYRPVIDDDPALHASLHVVIGAVVAAALLGWTLVRMATEPWRELFLGGFIRIVGTVLHAALAVGLVSCFCICVALVGQNPDRRFRGWDLFPRDVYYLDTVPVLIDPSTIVAIVAATLFVSIVFSVYPAIRAASYDPIEAIRDE